MAIVTATITVDFTAFYAGDHRICWRVQGSGDPYDCTTIVNCVGGGAACQGIFNADVNTTSCDGTVTFEGYVQATCEAESSLTGRLPFTVDFVPNPVCFRHEVLCAYGEIDNVLISPVGQEYILADTLTVVRDGSDTQVADATIQIASVGDGVINSISSLLSGGTGYAALDVINIVDTAGSGAGATITVDSILVGGIIDTFTLTTNGTDYIGPFTFSGGSGVGADFNIQPTVDYDVFGSILTLNIVDGGEYSIVPTITITTGTGSNAILTPELAACPSYDNLGTDCNSDSPTQIPPGVLEVGSVFAVCLDSDTVLAGPPEYSTNQTGCCVAEDTAGDACFDYHIENDSGVAQDVIYTACGGDVTTINVAYPGTAAICAVEDGVLDPGISGLTITNTGTPCS